jgi:hypothetical protein
MAKVIEQLVAIKLSKIVKEKDSESKVLNNEQLDMLINSITELSEQVLNIPGLVVEVLELE